MTLQRCRVVLVRPKIARNLGAAARIMRNMGLRDLVLVAPEADRNDQEARAVSTHGEVILNNARVVESLQDGLAGCSLVVGTTAKPSGPFRQSLGTPNEIIPNIVKRLTEGCQTALVFGPEPNGLGNDDLSCCEFLIHIPADPEYPALNLAQSVAICLYELRCAWCLLQSPTLPARLASPPAAFEIQDRMFSQLQTALEEIHFLYGNSAETLMHCLRQLIRRAKPTEIEVDVLFGLARQIRWYAKNNAGSSEPEA